jgi:hypothetical protein
VLVGGLTEGVLGEADLDEGRADEHMIQRVVEEQTEQLRSEIDDLRAEFEAQLQLANKKLALALSKAPQEEQPVQLTVLREEERNEGQNHFDDGHRERREQGKSGASSKVSTTPLVITPAGSGAAAVRQRVSPK